MKKYVLIVLTLLFLTVNVALAAININTADKDTLISLPGVGEKKAEAIIAYRKDHPFKTVKDIQNVKGIGEKVFEKISKDITTK